LNNKAGEALAAKQAPHQPGIAATLSLRAERDGFFIVSQTSRLKL
jgi:hypothetical protein